MEQEEDEAGTIGDTFTDYVSVELCIAPSWIFLANIIDLLLYVFLR